VRVPAGDRTRHVSVAGPREFVAAARRLTELPSGNSAPAREPARGSALSASGPIASCRRASVTFQCQVFKPWRKSRTRSRMELQRNRGYCTASSWQKCGIAILLKTHRTAMQDNRNSAASKPAPPSDRIAGNAMSNSTPALLAADIRVFPVGPRRVPVGSLLESGSRHVSYAIMSRPLRAIMRRN
jgi:hypothetical protein